MGQHRHVYTKQTHTQRTQPNTDTTTKNALSHRHKNRHNSTGTQRLKKEQKCWKKNRTLTNAHTDTFPHAQTLECENTFTQQDTDTHTHTKNLTHSQMNNHGQPYYLGTQET